MYRGLFFLVFYFCCCYWVCGWFINTQLHTKLLKWTKKGVLLIQTVHVHSLGKCSFALHSKGIYCFTATQQTTWHIQNSAEVGQFPHRFTSKTPQAAWKHARGIPCLPSSGIWVISFTEKNIPQTYSYRYWWSTMSRNSIPVLTQHEIPTWKSP